MSMPYNPAFRRAVRASRAAVVSEPPSGTPRGSTTMPPRPRSFSPTGLLATFALAAASALAATAPHAGTVYVPLPGVTNVGSATWEAEITVANASTTPLTLSGLLLPHDTDGTARAGLMPAVLNVGAAQTLLVKPGGSFVGLAEIAGSPNARYAARLPGKGAVGQMGVAPPVVSSSHAAAAAGPFSLRALYPGSTRATTIVLVTLAQQGSQCTVTLIGAGGAGLAPAATSNLKPLSQLDLGNVFNGLGSLADARANVSCTRSFFAYALTTDSATGEIAVVEPAASGGSRVARPGE